MVCRFGRGRCDNDAEKGSAFCEEHRKILAGFKAAVEAETGRSRPGRSKRKPKRCRFLDCALLAKPGRPYCKDHEAVINRGRTPPD